MQLYLRLKVQALVNLQQNLFVRIIKVLIFFKFVRGCKHVLWWFDPQKSGTTFLTISHKSKKSKIQPCFSQVRNVVEIQVAEEILQPFPQTGWIGPIGPQRRINKISHFFGFFRPLEKIAWNGPKWARELFFPINLDLANILGITDFDFEKFYFLDFCRSQISQTSKFLGRASSILLQYFFCHR